MTEFKTKLNLYFVIHVEIILLSTSVSKEAWFQRSSKRLPTGFLRHLLMQTTANRTFHVRAAGDLVCAQAHKPPHNHSAVHHHYNINRPSTYASQAPSTDPHTLGAYCFMDFSMFIFDIIVLGCTSLHHVSYSRSILVAS